MLELLHSLGVWASLLKSLADTEITTSGLLWLYKATQWILMDSQSGQRDSAAHG